MLSLEQMSNGSSSGKAQVLEDQSIEILLTEMDVCTTINDDDDDGDDDDSCTARESDLQKFIRLVQIN